MVLCPSNTLECLLLVVCKNIASTADFRVYDAIKLTKYVALIWAKSAWLHRMLLCLGVCFVWLVDNAGFSDVPVNISLVINGVIYDAFVGVLKTLTSFYFNTFHVPNF